MNKILVFILSFYSICPCFSQEQYEVDLNKEGLYWPLGSTGKVCQGEIVSFPIKWGQGYTYKAEHRDFYVSVNPNNCYTDVTSSLSNNTLTLEGDGLVIHTLHREPVNNDWQYEIQLKETAKLKVSWKERIYFAPNNCGYKSSETTYHGIYEKIFVVPIPPKPLLTANKAVVKNPESTTINCTDCPNTLAGNPEYPYLNGGSVVEYSFQCRLDGTPDFEHTIRYYNPPYPLPFDPRQIFYRPGAVFRARCWDNGCPSEISDPMAVGIQSSSPNCDDPKMAEIDNYLSNSRADYHQYTVETEVCNKADNNPNCTVEKVFELMRSSKTLAAPIAQDFTLIDNSNLGANYLSTKMSLIGSNLVFKLDDSPVQNCETVNLFSTGGMLINLAAMGAGINPYLLAKEIAASATSNPLSPTSNPVTQFIDLQSHSITNYTKEGHILHPGKITRTIVEDCNRIKIITIGSGRTWLGDKGEEYMRLGIAMAEINTRSGKVLFHNVDQRLIQVFNNLPR